MQRLQAERSKLREMHHAQTQPLQDILGEPDEEVEVPAEPWR